MKKLSIKTWISIITFVFIIVILFFSRHELTHAWELLGKVDWRILVLIIPVQLVGYLAVGEMIFSYLRQKGYMKKVRPTALMRMSLELNFVNHVLPSGGVSGISYMNWRLGKFGVPSGRGTMAQAVRYACGFASMIIMLALAVLLVTIDGHVNRWIILMSSTLVSLMVIATIAMMFVLSSANRMHHVMGALIRWINTLVRSITLQRVKQAINPASGVKFLNDMHDDYHELMGHKKILIKPLLWGILFTVTDVAVFWIVFWALGSPVNPAPILIAYGVASFAGFIVVTPGGAGAYEAIMVFVLSISGMSNGEAIAGIVLSRAIILAITIGVGWIFYQQEMMRYGGRPDTSLRR